MKKQIIISIGREFGSAGHEIAQALAARLNLPLYDNNLLKEISESNMIPENYLRQYDEKPAKPYFLQKLQNVGKTPEEDIAEMQFDFLRKLEAEGKSFVVVGRCAEYVLKYSPALISIFILGDQKTKTQRICDLYSISENDALKMMNQEDSKRKSYHNFFSKGKWGDSRNYDLTINSSNLGINGTIDFLEKYIQARIDAK